MSIQAGYPNNQNSPSVPVPGRRFAPIIVTSLEPGDVSADYFSGLGLGEMESV